MSAEIELDVNGERRRVRVEGDTPLLAVLRNDLGLTAAKYGCGLEQCYACAVLVDGEATTTCATPVEQFVGRRIVTVEGLGAGGALHPVQRAFLEEEAAQCGYCIPGMIVGAVALLERNPAPDERGDPCGARAAPLPLRHPLAHHQGGPPRRGGARVSTLPSALAAHPELDSWVRIDAGGTITVFTGKVELGQGIVAALARVAAEELDVALERVRVETADTDHGLDERFTAGSRSMTDSGSALRQAAAEARALLLELAAAELGVALEALEVDDGTITAPASGRSVSYWELCAGRPLARRASGQAAPKPAAAHRIVGGARAGAGRSPRADQRRDALRRRPAARGDAARARRATAEPGGEAREPRGSARARARRRRRGRAPGQLPRRRGRARGAGGGGGRAPRDGARAGSRRRRCRRGASSPRGFARSRARRSQSSTARPPARRRRSTRPPRGPTRPPTRGPT